MKTIAIIGAGGNARELAAIISNINCELSSAELRYEFLGFLADGNGQHDSPTLGTFDWLDSNHVDCLAMGIGNPAAKLSVGLRLSAKHPKVEWPILVDPSSIVAADCNFARGSIACVRSVASPNVRIGQFSQLNFGSAIGADVEIGDGCLVNPGAVILNRARIHSKVMVGTGAKILEGVTVGEGVIVGAGAVVDSDIPPGKTVMGNPAH